MSVTNPPTTTTPRAASPTGVQAYLHPGAGLAWLDVPGSGWAPDQRLGLRRLRLLPRLLPVEVSHLVIAVREPGSVSAELVTAALVARRVLAVRGVTMTVAIWGDAPMSDGLGEVLGRVHAVRPTADAPETLPFLTRAALDVRAERLGWTRWR